MKLPKNIKSCVEKTMPKWGSRFEKSESMTDLLDITRPKNLTPIDTYQGSALGNFNSCVVGEFYNFNKEENGSYGHCTACGRYSMMFHNAHTLERFAEIWKDFCDHGRKMHSEKFK